MESTMGMPVDQAGPEARVSDLELARRCAARDEEAVRELTNRYNQRLFRIARSILRSDADAEDAVQDAYIRALEHIGQFRGDSALGTWLTRITINEALGRSRRRSREVSDGLSMEPRVVRPGVPTPEKVMETQQTRALIERAIDRLPDDFRLVFVARMVEGLSVQETADLFDLKPETVKTRVHRARARLRADLESHVTPAVREAYAFDGDRCARMTERVVSRCIHRV